MRTHEYKAPSLYAKIGNNKLVLHKISSPNIYSPQISKTRMSANSRFPPKWRMCFSKFEIETVSLHAFFFILRLLLLFFLCNGVQNASYPQHFNYHVTAKLLQSTLHMLPRKHVFEQTYQGSTKKARFTKKCR